MVRSSVVEKLAACMQAQCDYRCAASLCICRTARALSSILRNNLNHPKAYNFDAKTRDRLMAVPDSHIGRLLSDFDDTLSEGDTISTIFNAVVEAAKRKGGKCAYPHF